MLAFLTREPSTNHQSQAGFLTRILPKKPFPSKKDSGTTSFGLPTHPELTLTAARPPRIFTVFPFHISSLIGRTCNQIFSFQKNKRKIPERKIKATEKLKKFYFSTKITISRTAIAKVQTAIAPTKTHINRLC